MMNNQYEGMQKRLRDQQRQAMERMHKAEERRRQRWQQDLLDQSNKRLQEQMEGQQEQTRERQRRQWEAAVWQQGRQQPGRQGLDPATLSQVRHILHRPTPEETRARMKRWAAAPMTNSRPSFFGRLVRVIVTLVVIAIALAVVFVCVLVLLEALS